MSEALWSRIEGPQGVRAFDLGPRTAPPALLLHGLGSLSDEMLLGLREGLAAAGLRVVAIDRPGYGGTAPPTGPSGPAAQARWLTELLERFDVKRPLIVGHSYGAAVSLWLARELGPDAAGLVLVNPFCRPSRPAAAPLIRLAIAPVVGAPVRRTVAPALAGGLVRWSLVSACAPDRLPKSLTGLPCQAMARESAVLAMAAELQAFNADMASLPRDRARITAPAIAICGTADRVIPGPSHGQWLQSRFGVEVRELDAGHMIHHTRTEAVLGAVQDVLSR